MNHECILCILFVGDDAISVERCFPIQADIEEVCFRLPHILIPQGYIPMLSEVLQVGQVCVTSYLCRCYTANIAVGVLLRLLTCAPFSRLIFWCISEKTTGHRAGVRSRCVF